MDFFEKKQPEPFFSEKKSCFVRRVWGTRKKPQSPPKKDESTSLKTPDSLIFPARMACNMCRSGVPDVPDYDDDVSVQSDDGDEGVSDSSMRAGPRKQKRRPRRKASSCSLRRPRAKRTKLPAARRVSKKRAVSKKRKPARRPSAKRYNNRR